MLRLKKKKNAPRVSVRHYLQRRLMLGHHDNLMREFLVEDSDLNRNFLQVDSILALSLSLCPLVGCLHPPPCLAGFLEEASLQLCSIVCLC